MSRTWSSYIQSRGRSPHWRCRSQVIIVEVNAASHDRSSWRRHPPVVSRWHTCACCSQRWGNLLVEPGGRSSQVPSLACASDWWSLRHRTTTDRSCGCDVRVERGGRSHHMLLWRLMRWSEESVSMIGAVLRTDSPWDMAPTNVLAHVLSRPEGPGGHLPRD